MTPKAKFTQDKLLSVPHVEKKFYFLQSFRWASVDKDRSPHILYILQRLAGTGWDVSFTTSSSSIIALAYSTADYAASALSYSTLPTLPIQVYSTCQVILPSFAAAYIIWLQQLYHMTAAATSDICDCGPPNITHVNHDSIMYKLPNTVAILTILDNDTIDWLLSDLPV